MKKKISALLALMLVLLAPLGMVPSSVNASWETECLPANTIGQECMFFDVFDYNSDAWVDNSANYDPGDRAKFALRYWNNTDNAIGNTTFKVTLPAGLTLVPNQVTAYLNGNAMTVTDQLFTPTGWTFPGDFPKKSYMNIYVRADISGTHTPGAVDYTPTGSVSTLTGFSGSNTATAHVNYVLPPDSGLTGRYYNNKFLQGSPSLTRVDGIVDSTNPALDWPLLGNPGGGLGDDNFSVSWTGQVKSSCTGPIDLRTNSDDGVRVFFNNQLVIDKWFDRAQPVTKDSATVNMTADTWNNIRVDYFEHGGGSIAQLFWNSACQTAGEDQIIPQQYLRQTYTGTMNYGLTGEYFNNTQVSGAPVVTQTDLGLYYSFDNDSPAPGIGVDQFSIKWTGKITADYAENYQFCIKSDDGARLWIDDTVVIDEYHPHGFAQYCGNIDLTAGAHNIRLDYFDSYIDAAMQARWSSPSQTGGTLQYIPLNKLSPAGFSGTTFGLTGTYYNTVDFTGAVALSRVDGPINFDFGQGSPDALIDPNTFSIVWTGKIRITEAGNYNFVVYSDDGVRLRIDGSIEIDQLTNQSLTRSESGPIALTAGDHTISLHYFDFQEGAGVRLMYTTPSNATETVIPASVLLAN